MALKKIQILTGSLLSAGLFAASGALLPASANTNYQVDAEPINVAQLDNGFDNDWDDNGFDNDWDDNGVQTQPINQPVRTQPQQQQIDFDDDFDNDWDDNGFQRQDVDFDDDFDNNQPIRGMW